MPPLRILSVDGGGVRGRAVLEILAAQLKAAGHPEDVQPGKLFDMMGGTSTGGLVALLLGRLGLTIPEAISLYEDVSKSIFRSSGIRQTFRWMKTRARFDATLFEEKVKEEIERRFGCQDEPLANQDESACKTYVHPFFFFTKKGNLITFFSFVVAVRKSEVSAGLPVLFRSYGTAAEKASTCPIWQAARATSAAPWYFRPQKIDGDKFVDGGLGSNNPCALLVNEAESQWPGRPIGTILSIGTGSKLGRGTNPLFAGLGIATGTESIHRVMEGRFRGKGIYYRFQVGGLGGEVSLNQWRKMPLIRQRTSEYLSRPEVQGNLEQAARAWAPTGTAC
jgi:predicted acylesterase/phospholipase RssA